MAEKLTPEEIAEAKIKADRSTASKASRAKRLAAIAYIIGFVNDNVDEKKFTPELTSSIARLSGGARTSGVATKRNVILDYLNEQDGKEASEDVMFSEFKLGRMELRAISNDLIKKVTDPKDRVWISFDPETGMYKVAGKGAKPPKGWTGYLPVVVEEVEEVVEEEDEEEDDDDFDIDEDE